MNNTCDVCSKNTKGWVTTSYKASTYCYCSYECYKKMPTIIPTQHIYKCLEVDNPDPIIVPLTRKDINSFTILTETEINQLTNDEYKNYKLDLEEENLLNPIKSQVYHEGLENDKKQRELEDEFYNSFSDDETIDDY